MFRLLNKYNSILILLLFKISIIEPIGNPFKAIYNWWQKRKSNQISQAIKPQRSSTGFFSNSVKSSGETFAEGASNKIINEKLPEGLYKLRDLTKDGEVGAEVLANLTKPLVNTTSKIERLTDKIYRHFKKSISICIGSLISIILVWYLLKILTIYVERRIK